MSSRRRIALMTGNYVTLVDGVALTLNRLVRFLEAAGDEVIVFAPGSAQPALEPAGTFVPVPAIPFILQPEYRMAIGFPRRARQKLDSFRPDLLHLATPDVLGRKGVAYARQRGLPVVASFHTNIASYFRYMRGFGPAERLAWGSMRRFYAHCQQLYVPTPSMIEELERRGVETPMRLWPRGVDTRRFNPARRSLAWRRAQGIADEDVVVTFVARLRPEKGLKVLRDVFTSLASCGLPSRALVVGDGPSYAQMRKWLPDAIMPGHLEGDQLATAYASGDIFLYPSETDTFGSVTLEAMASGLPTVCADAPGSRSIVVDGETGFLASSRDPSSFVEHISSLLRDPGLRRSMADRALARASSFEWDACLQRLGGYYDEVLAGQKLKRGSANLPSPL